jgi:peroxiredoxin
MTNTKLCSVLLLATVASVGAQTSKIQAILHDAKDRPAAPAFVLKSAAGKAVRLSDFRGKPLVINLWATECGGCKAELPTFVDLSRTYKGLTVLGVSMDIMYEDLKSADEGWARVKPFLPAHGIQYPIALDDGSVENAFKVTALPATYLIDRSGRVAATYIGVVDPTNLEANIKALLAER